MSRTIQANNDPIRANADAIWRAHSTPDPDAIPGEKPNPTPSPDPDDIPTPTHAPVEEPRMPEPPIKA